MNTGGVVSRDTQERHPADFTSTPGAPNVPSIKAMGGVERVFGAQQVQVYRDETKVLAKLKTLAAAAGGEWFYRFPVRNRQTNSTDWVEGPSIKLANDLARIYGNCDVDSRVVDLGDSWLIYARIIDLESGFSMTRPFQQRKAQTSVNTKDPGRAQDMALQIGVSKAIRNVITNALQTFADFAFDEARNALVDKVGKDIENWRRRTIEGLAKIPVDLKRVELVVGRAAKDWLAPDIARVIAMMKSIADGMALLSEVFPDPSKTEEAPAQSPRRPTTAEDTLDQFGSAGEGGPPGAADAQTQTDGTQEHPPAREPANAPGGLFTDDAASGPPTDVASYMAFAARVIDDARAQGREAVLGLSEWVASDAQKKMRAGCKLGKGDTDALHQMVREAIEAVSARPKK